MFSFLAIGHLIFRRADMVNTLGGAVLLILILYPFGVGDIGFLASVGSCLGIIVLAEPIYRIFPLSFRNIKFSDKICRGLSITISALTGILPCILLCFYDLPLIAPLVNLLGIPLAGFVMISGLVGTVISLIPPFEFITEVLLLACGICSNLLLQICRFFGQFSFTNRPFVSVWCLMAFCLCIIGAGLCYRYKNHLKPSIKSTIALLLTVVLILSTFVPVYHKNTHEIFVITNAYHTSLAIIGSDGTVVIGCDLPYQLQRVLANRGVQKIDRLVLPNDHSYYKNLRSLTDYYPITQTHIAPETLEKGLLTGLEEKVGILSLTRHIALDGIEVTANQDFTTFTVTVQGQTFYYNRPETQTTGASITGALCATFDTTAAIRIKNQNITFYQPRFLFG
jgi:hypothetical protein